MWLYLCHLTFALGLLCGQHHYAVDQRWMPGSHLHAGGHDITVDYQTTNGRCLKGLVRIIIYLNNHFIKCCI